MVSKKVMHIQHWWQPDLLLHVEEVKRVAGSCQSKFQLKIYVLASAGLCCLACMLGNHSMLASLHCNMPAIIYEDGISV